MNPAISAHAPWERRKATAARVGARERKGRRGGFGRLPTGAAGGSGRLSGPTLSPERGKGNGAIRKGEARRSWTADAQERK